MAAPAGSRSPSGKRSVTSSSRCTIPVRGSPLTTPSRSFPRATRRNWPPLDRDAGSGWRWSSRWRLAAARDVESLRSAMHGGVVHYLIKPFRFAALKEKLESYAAMRQRLAQLSEADQHAVDTLYHILRQSSDEALPKGLARPTLELVMRILQDAGRDLTATEVADLASLSRVTARRYLDHLVQSGRVELVMRYGSPGRPEHHYHLVGATLPTG